METREAPRFLLRRVTAALSTAPKNPDGSSSPKPTDEHESTLRKAGGVWKSWLDSEYPPK